MPRIGFRHLPALWEGPFDVLLRSPEMGNLSQKPGEYLRWIELKGRFETHAMGWLP